MSQPNITRAFSFLGGSFVDFKSSFVVIVNIQQMFTVAEVSAFILYYDSNINKHM